MGQAGSTCLSSNSRNDTTYSPWSSGLTIGTFHEIESNLVCGNSYMLRSRDHMYKSPCREVLLAHKFAFDTVREVAMDITTYGPTEVGLADQIRQD